MPVSDALATEIPWAQRHPHLSEPTRYKSNTLYLASERLLSLDLDSPGGGVFDRLRSEPCSDSFSESEAIALSSHHIQDVLDPAVWATAADR